MVCVSVHFPSASVFAEHTVHTMTMATDLSVCRPAGRALHTHGGRGRPGTRTRTHIHTHTHTLRSYSFRPAYTLARTYRSPRPPVPTPTVTSMAMFPGLVRPLYRACGTSLHQCYNALRMPLFSFHGFGLYTLNALCFFNFNCCYMYSDYDLFPPLFREGTNAATPNRDELDYDNYYARTLRVI